MTMYQISWKTLMKHPKTKRTDEFLLQSDVLYIYIFLSFANLKRSFPLVGKLFKVQSITYKEVSYFIVTFLQKCNLMQTVLVETVNTAAVRLSARERFNYFRNMLLM